MLEDSEIYDAWKKIAMNLNHRLSLCGLPFESKLHSMVGCLVTLYIGIGTDWCLVKELIYSWAYCDIKAAYRKSQMRYSVFVSKQ